MPTDNDNSSTIDQDFGIPGTPEYLRRLNMATARALAYWRRASASSADIDVRERYTIWLELNALQERYKAV